MDRIVLMLMIGFLFATTLWQAREIGKQGVVLAVQEATRKHEKAMAGITRTHQTKLATVQSQHQTEIEGYKNELTEMASTFEDMGLSDASGLGERESGWLNDFMRRNSRQASGDSTNNKNIPPASPDKAKQTKD